MGYLRYLMIGVIIIMIGEKFLLPFLIPVDAAIMPSGGGKEEEESPSCPFCLIAASYPPSTPPHLPAPPTAPLFPATHILLSTHHALSFLDVMPQSPAHLLLIPRAHHETLRTLPPSLNAAVTAWLPILARAATKVVGVGDFNVISNNGVSAGQVVGHVHWHLVPRAGREEKERMEKGERREWWGVGNKEEEEGWGWERGLKGVRGDLSDEEGERIAGLIREELGREVETLEGGERRILAVL